MNIYRGNDSRPTESGAVVTVGFFDGVHKGHQEVLAETNRRANSLNAPSGVITFGEHPRRVLTGSGPNLITGIEHRLVLFARYGIDFSWALEFTQEWSRQTARSFFEEYLKSRLNISGLVVGHDTRMGSDQLAADSDAMKKIADTLNIQLWAAPKIEDDNVERLSSTPIREAVSEGRLNDAGRMLGRSFSVYGTVVKGDQRGRVLGFPTANLFLGNDVRPPMGVYAGKVNWNGKTFFAAINVGRRPTISDGSEIPIVEVHLLDFNEDIYGKNIEVEFVRKIREELKFTDLDALKNQIQNDVDSVRKICS